MSVGISTVLICKLVLLVTMSSLRVGVSEHQYTNFTEEHCGTILYTFNGKTGEAHEVAQLTPSKFNMKTTRNCSNIIASYSNLEVHTKYTCAPIVIQHETTLSKKSFLDGILCCSKQTNCIPESQKSMLDLRETAIKSNRACQKDAHDNTRKGWCFYAILYKHEKENSEQLQDTFRQIAKIVNAKENRGTLGEIAERVNNLARRVMFTEEELDSLPLKIFDCEEDQMCSRYTHLIFKINIVICCCKDDICFPALRKKDILLTLSCRVPENSHNKTDSFERISTEGFTKTEPQTKQTGCALKITAEVNRKTDDKLVIYESHFNRIASQEDNDCLQGAINRSFHCLQQPHNTCPLSQTKPDYKNQFFNLTCCCKGVLCEWDFSKENFQDKISLFWNSIPECNYDQLPPESAMKIARYNHRCYKTMLLQDDDGDQSLTGHEIAFYADKDRHREWCSATQTGAVLVRNNSHTTQSYWCKKETVQLDEREIKSCQRTESNVNLFVCCCDFGLKVTNPFCNDWNMSIEFEAYKSELITTTAITSSTLYSFSNAPIVCYDGKTKESSSQIENWYCHFNEENYKVCCCQGDAQICNPQQLVTATGGVVFQKAKPMDTHNHVPVYCIGGRKCIDGCYNVTNFDLKRNKLFGGYHGCLENMKSTFDFFDMKIMAEKKSDCFEICGARMVGKWVNGNEQLTVVCVCRDSPHCNSADMHVVERFKALAARKKQQALSQGSGRIQSTAIFTPILVVLFRIIC